MVIKLFSFFSSFSCTVFQAVHAVMSRFLSLCSQHRASGVLARVVQLFDSECEKEKAPGGDEVQLGKVIGKAERVGCACSDQLDALAALSSVANLSTNDLDIQIQAFGCAALLLERIMRAQSVLFHPLRGTPKNGAPQRCTSSHSGRGEVMCNIDMRNVIELLQHASDIGSGDASLKLGVCFDEGDCVAQDKMMAVELYQQAAEIDNVDALYMLGVWNECGDDPKDKKAAFESFQEAAEMGHAGAMFKLAVYYEHGNMGDGVPTDVEKSRWWYKQSADCGYDDAIQAIKKGHPFLTLNLGLPQWHH